MIYPITIVDTILRTFTPIKQRFKLISLPFQTVHLPKRGNNNKRKNERKRKEKISNIEDRYERRKNEAT